MYEHPVFCLASQVMDLTAVWEERERQKEKKRRNHVLKPSCLFVTPSSHARKIKFATL